MYELQSNRQSAIADWHNNRQYETDTYKVKLIEPDLNSWLPDFMANLIATELLSFPSNNELSHDGTQPYFISKTIPQKNPFVWHLAPMWICQLRLELHNLNMFEAYVLSLDRLRNYYMVSQLQQLANFERKDLDSSARNFEYNLEG